MRFQDQVVDRHRRRTRPRASVRRALRRGGRQGRARRPARRRRRRPPPSSPAAVARRSPSQVDVNDADATQAMATHGDRGVRPHRRARQQRRHLGRLRGRAAARDRPGLLGLRDGRQRARPAALLAGGGADDGRPGPRPHHQHLVDRRLHGVGRVRRVEAGAQPAHVSRSPRSSARRASPSTPSPRARSTTRPAGARSRRRRWTASATATLVKRLGDADDIYGMIAYLASDDAAWVTGQTYMVNGGFSSRL